MSSTPRSSTSSTRFPASASTWPAPTSGTRGSTARAAVSSAEQRCARYDRAVAFPIDPPIEPMLAALQREIPRGDGWLYEPKWDGFRAIVFRDDDRVHIGSRKELPLDRYFPEIVDVVKDALPARAVADGEIILPGEN